MIVTGEAINMFVYKCFLKRCTHVGVAFDLAVTFKIHLESDNLSRNPEF